MSCNENGSIPMTILQTFEAREWVSKERERARKNGKESETETMRENSFKYT